MQCVRYIHLVFNRCRPGLPAKRAVELIQPHALCTFDLKQWQITPPLCPRSILKREILFIHYTADLQEIIAIDSLLPHLYADDTQICGSCRLENAEKLSQSVSSCIDEVARWMSANRLQLNAAKTEVIWFATSRRHQSLIPTSGLRVGDDVILTVKSVRDLASCSNLAITMPPKYIWA